MLLKATPYKNQKIENYYQKALDNVSSFFKIEGFNSPSLMLLENREAVDIAKGKKTQDWVVGWYSDRIVYLLCPENYSEESSHTYSDKEYEKLIKHEVGHFFYKALVGSYRPIWLSEGISVYLSKQHKERKQPKIFEHFLKYYNRGDEKIYTESGYAVKLLVDGFGEEKLIKFVKSLWNHKSPQDVEKKFQEVFEKPLSFGTFNSL